MQPIRGRNEHPKLRAPAACPGALLSRAPETRHGHSQRCNRVAAQGSYTHSPHRLPPQSKLAPIGNALPSWYTSPPAHESLHAHSNPNTPIPPQRLRTPPNAPKSSSTSSLSSQTKRLGHALAQIPYTWWHSELATELPLELVLHSELSGNQDITVADSVLLDW